MSLFSALCQMGVHEICTRIEAQVLVCWRNFARPIRKLGRPALQMTYLEGSPLLLVLWRFVQLEILHD